MVVLHIILINDTKRVKAVVYLSPIASKATMFFFMEGNERAVYFNNSQLDIPLIK